MIADVRSIVTGAASSREQRNTAKDQAASRRIVVDAGYPRDVNGSGIENGLPARNRCPRGRGRLRRPGVKRVEDRWCELAVTRRHKPTRSFKCGNQRVDAGIHADKERLSGQRYASGTCAMVVQSAAVAPDGLSREASD